MATALNNNLHAVKHLPWEIVMELFPKSYLLVVGEKWVREFMFKDSLGDTHVKGHWETETYPQHIREWWLATEIMNSRFSKGHARIVRVIPELEPQKPRVFNHF